jgi:hypothetical protein
MEEDIAMKKTRRPMTLQELWELEEKYPFSAGNPLSLGAAHFRTPPQWRVAAKAKNGARRPKKVVAK